MLRNITLATLDHGDGFGLGIKTDRGILDVRQANAALGLQAPDSIDAVLQQPDRHGALEQLLQQVRTARGTESLYRDEARAAFGPCVTNPEKIVCVGLNYRRHSAETGNPIPTVPILFSKFRNALCAHRGAVNVSAVPAEQFDYEAELVIVIGKTARNVSETDALTHVFGYCVGNDFSARDLQLRSSQWMLGKTSDGFAPIGPYLVSADQVPDPNKLAIECRVNGERRQSSNTSDMVFSCAALVSYISRYFTLRPGDIVFTGTPEGVILGYPKEKQAWLKPGDRVTTTIERLGTLEFALT